MNNDSSKSSEIPEVRDDRRFLAPIIAAVGRMWKPLWDDPKRVVRILAYICGFLLLWDLAMRLLTVDEHAHLHWENGIWFYAVYGFVSYALLVLISKHLLRPFIMRDEDYYD